MYLQKMAKDDIKLFTQQTGILAHAENVKYCKDTNTVFFFVRISFFISQECKHASRNTHAFFIIIKR